MTDDAMMYWDPSLPDVTGHMLLALGRVGHRVSEPRVGKAIDYLRRVQFDNGMWYGYFGITYLYGTTQVLLGLRAVEEDMNASHVRRAVNWLLLQQQPAGCWGETVEAMTDPTYAGRGPCTPVQTAWCLLGLLAAKEPVTSPAVKRAADWLLDRQRTDGSWQADRVFFAYRVEYHQPHDGITWPLWALAAYRNAGGTRLH